MKCRKTFTAIATEVKDYLNENFSEITADQGYFLADILEIHTKAIRHACFNECLKEKNNASTPLGSEPEAN